MYLYKGITAAIALIVDQPVLILEREGLPTDIEDIPTPAHSPKGEWQHSAESQQKE